VCWTERLSDVPVGGWGLVIRAPGGYSLGRCLAKRHAGGHYVFGALSGKERRALERRKGTLVLDLDWDPLVPQEDIVGELIQSIERFGLDPANIRLVHSNQSAREEFEALWRERTNRELLRTLEFPTSFALAVAYHHGRWRQEDMDARLHRAREALDGAARGKLFASFNGGLRALRLHMLAWMHHARLLERGHVSMLAYSKTPRVLKRLRPDASSRPPANLQASLDKMPYAEKVAPSLLEVWKRLPLTLDVERDFRDRRYERVVWESPEPRYFDDSWFSVVVESHADRMGALHITEKVAKPMLNAHPFVVLGSQNELAQLRSYGFESFAPEFHEEYDGWLWPGGRIQRFLKELRRLCELPEADLAGLCVELWPRCEHNFRHFLGGGAREALSAVFERDVLDQLVG
jgi:hypothetical protein